MTDEQLIKEYLENWKDDLNSKLHKVLSHAWMKGNQSEEKTNSFNTAEEEVTEMVKVLYEYLKTKYTLEERTQ